MKKLKEEIQQNVIKQIKGLEDITVSEIGFKLSNDRYANILKGKKIDPLMKLRLDYIKQMNEEDLANLNLNIYSQ